MGRRLVNSEQGSARRRAHSARRWSRSKPLAAIAGVAVASLAVMGIASPSLAEETAPAEAPVVEQSVAAEAPVVEAPVVEAPVVEAPVVEAPAADTPVVEPPAVAEPAADPAIVPAPETLPAGPPAAGSAQATDPADPAAAVDAPPYLRFAVIDAAGTPLPGTTVQMQGVKNLSVADDGADSQWAGALTLTALDNIGQAGYAGLDLDPAPGAMLVKQLVDDSDPGAVHDVAAGETYRVRAVAAPEGLAVGDDAAWTEIASAADAGETGQLVLAPAAEETPEPAAEPPAAETPAEPAGPAARTAAPEANLLAAPPGTLAKGSYGRSDDADPTSTWTTGGPPSPQAEINNFTSSVDPDGADWRYTASWSRTGVNGEFGWVVEYTVAGESWGPANVPAADQVPRPDRSLGGTAIRVNSKGQDTRAIICTYTSQADYPTSWSGSNCVTILNAATYGPNTVSLDFLLPSELFGTPGCPPTFGSTAYVRAWTGGLQLQTWAAPQPFTPPSTCGSLSIVKAFDATVPAGAASGVTFTGTYACVVNSQTVASGTWSRTGTGAATLTPATGSPAPTAIPPGATCSATENAPIGGLPNGSWAWDSPTITGPVTIVEQTPSSITVTNQMKRLYGGFQVTKVVPEGSTADADAAYAGGWACAFEGEQTATGTWGPIKAGETWTMNESNTVLLGSTCSVTSETRADWPVVTDHSYQWDGAPGLGDSVIATSGGLATITVTNRTERVLGSVAWSKVDGGGAALAGSEWELTGPTGFSTMQLSAETCTGSAVPTTEPTCTYTDVGKFSVDNLLWGDYTLRETKAPAGYIPDTTAHPFTIGEGSLEGVIAGLDGNAVVNLPIPGPALPMSGGLGSDFYALAGGGVMLAGLATAGVLMLRRRREEVV